MGSRILPKAADVLREAIRENRGDEVFAIGEMDGGSVCSLEITARGQADRVIALIDRPRAGQVVIHNHPSGDLTPSDADMQLAGIYGEGGVGVVIVDNDVTSANWVVEPYLPARVVVSENDVRLVFESQLPKVLPNHETRSAQIDMAMQVTAALNEGRPLAVEAGTGTGKSLAYLVPSALWALANESKVVISTYTRTLQAQLRDQDVPTLSRAGIDARVEVLQGRNNYLCRRRLALAAAESSDDALAPVFDALAAWSESTADGSRLNLPDGVDSAMWDRVQSATDLSMKARCPHFARCHWYTALRRASAAQILIVNHALLLADRNLHQISGRGILPKYERVILDEAHHLEQAATSASSQRTTHRALRNLLLPLLDRPNRPGALTRLARQHFTGGLPQDIQRRAETEAMQVSAATEDLLVQAEHTLEGLGEQFHERALRITDEVAASAKFRQDVVPPVKALAASLEGLSESIEHLRELLRDQVRTEAQMQPMLDLRRAQHRAVSHTDTLRSFLAPREGHARWLERARTGTAVCWSPIDVAAELRRLLWNPLPGTVCTSATLTVGGSFRAWSDRVGAQDLPTVVFPSPFDHFSQAVLGLPRDLPEPNTPEYAEAIANAVLSAVESSDGGAFVLCTSHADVQRLSAHLRAPRSRTVLAQGDGERTQLLHRFRNDRRAVLVGTDSFWEGVSISGDGLRLVILPRIPFRVPSDPLNQARHEALEEAGVDAFRALTLPAAVLKLRQGYGRLIRSRTDRGAVLLLDVRIHTRRYGQILLQSLPPARRVKGPLAWVQQQIDEHQNRGTPSPGSSRPPLSVWTPDGDAPTDQSGDQE